MKYDENKEMEKDSLVMIVRTKKENTIETNENIIRIKKT